MFYLNGLIMNHVVKDPTLSFTHQYLLGFMVPLTRCPLEAVLDNIILKSVFRREMQCINSILIKMAFKFGLIANVGANPIDLIKTIISLL